MFVSAPSPSLPISPPDRLTEAQFVAWASEAGDVRAEWVDGRVVIMSAVELAHARIVQFLVQLLGVYAAERELGEVLGEPYHIRFSKLRRRRMPDLMFVSAARTRLLQRMHFEGAPDLIVEVVSPDSQTRDRREKFLEYQQIGVREYWIVDPLVKGVELYSLKRAKGYVRMAVVDDAISFSRAAGPVHPPRVVLATTAAQGVRAAEADGRDVIRLPRGRPRPYRNQ